MCRHEVNFLLGTADGIVCRKCGAKFASFEEINGEAPQAAPEAPAAPEKPKATRTRKKKEE